MNTLYITDLDGTLLDPSASVTPRSASLLNEAISGGALFTVATARTPATVAPLLSEIDVRMPVAVMTGAALWNPADGRYSEVRHIDSDTVRKVLELYASRGFETFLYELRDNHVEIYHTGKMSRWERAFMEAREGNPYKTFHRDERGEMVPPPEPACDVVLMFAMQPAEDVEDIAARLRAMDAPVVVNNYRDIYSRDAELMEVFGKGATKGEAVARLRKLAGADRTVVFGDHVNDIPMMRHADVAVAVANAVDEVKEAADIVIGPNTEDSVARFILEDSRS